MNEQFIEKLIRQGEGVQVEFKESFSQLNKDIFESICAFLNRKGGHVLLGVSNNRNIEGILESEAERLCAEIINNTNNPGKLQPAFPLSPEIINYHGKKLILLFVPESSMVHQTVGKTFDRKGDSDQDISRKQDAITALHLRKQQTFTENRIYPFLQFEDLRTDLIERARRLARSQRPDHPWLELDNKALLRSAGVYQRDYATGQEGYTLGGALLFGRDEVIRDIVPHYRTDALYRVENTDRYDDRHDIRTNLIEAYDYLMAFIDKHLPDKFYQEPNAQRVSIRDIIFREVIANMLIHREYAAAHPAKLIIEQNRVTAENWNKPHTHGALKPDRFAPFPKNPVLARFFKEIGRMEELGSGVRNLYRYTPLYTDGGLPEIVEDDVFRTIIPIVLPDISSQDSNQDGNPKNIDYPHYIMDSRQLHERINDLLRTSRYSDVELDKVRHLLTEQNEHWFSILTHASGTPKSRKALFEVAGVSNQTKNFKSIIQPLIDLELLDMLFPDRPTSSNQRYVLTEKGDKLLQLLSESSKD